MENIETIHDRIKQLVDTFGDGKNTVFASMIGSNEANVRGYIKNVMPKYDFLEKIARNIEINLDWLLTGRGSMIREEQPATQATPSIQPADDSLLLNLYKEKEAKIETQAEQIGALKQQVRTLEKQLEDLGFEEINQQEVSAGSTRTRKRGAAGQGDVRFAER